MIKTEIVFGITSQKGLKTSVAVRSMDVMHHHPDRHAVSKPEITDLGDPLPLPIGQGQSPEACNLDRHRNDPQCPDPLKVAYDAGL